MRNDQTRLLVSLSIIALFALILVLHNQSARRLDDAIQNIHKIQLTLNDTMVRFHKEQTTLIIEHLDTKITHVDMQIGKGHKLIDMATTRLNDIGNKTIDSHTRTFKAIAAMSDTLNILQSDIKSNLDNIKYTANLHYYTWVFYNWAKAHGRKPEDLIRQARKDGISRVELITFVGEYALQLPSLTENDAFNIIRCKRNEIPDLPAVIAKIDAARLKRQKLYQWAANAINKTEKYKNTFGDRKLADIIDFLIWVEKLETDPYDLLDEGRKREISKDALIDFIGKNAENLPVLPRSKLSNQINMIIFMRMEKEMSGLSSFDTFIDELVSAMTTETMYRQIEAILQSPEKYRELRRKHSRVEVIKNWHAYVTQLQQSKRLEYLCHETEKKFRNMANIEVTKFRCPSDMEARELNTKIKKIGGSKKAPQWVKNARKNSNVFIISRSDTTFSPPEEFVYYWNAENNAVYVYRWIVSEKRFIEVNNNEYTSQTIAQLAVAITNAFLYPYGFETK